MSAREGTITGEQEEPLPPPIPGPEFRRLTRGQSIVAWTIGWIVGLAVAAAVIVLLVLGLI